MILNKLIDNETFYSLIEMFQREGKKVSDKISNDKYKSFVIETEQYIFTDELNNVNKNIFLEADDKQGVYLNQDKKAIAATVSLSKLFKDFAKSDYEFMRVPNSLSGLTGLHKLDKQQAKELLQQIIDIAINRKAGQDNTKELEKLKDYQHDARIINDLLKNRIRRSGRNILKVPKLKKMYPDIDNSPLDESFVGKDVDAKEYIEHHGKKPSGAGKWIFGIGSRNKKDWFSFDGNFSQAKNAAYEEAEKRGKKKIYVMEDFNFKYIDVSYKIIKESNVEYKVSLVVEDKEIYATKALTENSARNIGTGWLFDKLIEVDLLERKMNKSEKKKSESIVKGMKKKIGSFKDRYGKDAKKVMYATANKLAKEYKTEKKMKKESLENKLKLIIEEESFEELSSEPTYRKPYKAVEAEPQFVDGWKIVDNLGQSLGGVYTKDEAKTLVDVLNSTSEVSTMGYKNLYIKDGEGEKVKDRSLKGVKLKEIKESKNRLKESTKNFKIKFEQKSTDGTQTTNGEKVISAPDAVLARKRVEEDNKDLPGFRVVSVSEVV